MSASKKIKNRERDILDALRTSHAITIEEAMNLLGVSASTVRRLFAKLEQEGHIIRTYGGVRLIADNLSEQIYSFDKTEFQAREEKKRIAAAAESLIEEGDMLFLDSGTTVSQLCAEIVSHCEINTGVQAAGKPSKYDKVVIFTNSLANLNIMQKNVKINLIGGEYRVDRRDFCGYFAEETIKHIHFTKCFIGADGYNIDHGLTAMDFLTARINQLVVENSRYKILLADSSKLNKISYVSYCKIKQIDCLITDPLPGETSKRLGELGIKVIEV